MPTLTLALLSGSIGSRLYNLTTGRASYFFAAGRRVVRDDLGEDRPSGLGDAPALDLGRVGIEEHSGSSRSSISAPAGIVRRGARADRATW